MGVPAVITAGGAAILAANPAVAVPVVAAYTANMAVRAAFRAQEYAVSQAQVSQLQAIAEALQDVVIKLDTITERMISADTGNNMVEAVEGKGLMPDVLSININNDNAVDSSGIDERWSIHS